MKDYKLIKGRMGRWKEQTEGKNIRSLEELVCYHQDTICFHIKLSISKLFCGVIFFQVLKLTSR